MDLRETGREREREGERERYLDSLTRDQTQNLGRCPGQESNLQHFGVQDGTPTN